MRYYFIVGEASGDLHGANLIKCLKGQGPTAQMRGWGGDLMAQAGMALARHYRGLAFMGFWEVVKNLPAISRNFKACKRDITAFAPDVLVLIDYPGFNLRMAKWAKRQGLRVFYYISPQLWAWHSSRVKIIGQAVERMYVILPFEKGFYEKHHVEVDYVGHPLLDVVANLPERPGFLEENNLSSKPIIALLPGSRKQEIVRMLKTMLEVIPFFPDYQFVIAAAPSIDRAFYESLIPPGSRAVIMEGGAHALLQNAHAALVTSGTATLETALFNVPQVVCYKGNGFSYWLAKLLVNRDLQFISLVNLIAGKQVVAELIQGEFNWQNLRGELDRLLSYQCRRAMMEGYAVVRDKLGAGGASKLAAKLMVERLRN